MGLHEAAPVNARPQTKREREPRPSEKLTRRQERERQYEADWQKIRKKHQQRRQEEGRPAEDHKLGPVRPTELICTLERFRNATGDPIFADALTAIHRYGLDHEPLRTATRIEHELYGDPADDYLVQVGFLVTRGLWEPEAPIGRSKKKKGRRRKLSVREACAYVVSEAGLPGSSFNAAVERLRKRYQAKRPPPHRPLHY